MQRRFWQFFPFTAAARKGKFEQAREHGNFFFTTTTPTTTTGADDAKVILLSTWL
jgi:hypothetical protein